MSESSKRYLERLAELVKAKFGGKAVSLCEVLPYCAGAFPTDVEKVLRQLHYRGHLQLRRERSARNIRQRHRSRVDAILPLPHPANYDWRFAAETRMTLRRRIKKIAGASGSVALLGAPSMFLALKTDKRPILLLDRNPTAIAELKKFTSKAHEARQQDLFERYRCPSKFDVAIADPPWYLEHYQSFIFQAAGLLRMGGWLVLSVLPPLTRPSAIQDRRKIQSMALAAGFDLAEKWEGKAIYDSPPFEQQTLAESRIFCQPKWRIADFFLFKKMRPSKSSPGVVSTKEPRWSTFRFGDTEVKLRQGKDESRRILRIERLAHGGATLGSVSRRDPTRSKIALWTSGNVAYSSSRLLPLREVLLRIEQGAKVEDAVREVSILCELAPAEGRRLSEFLRTLSLGDSA